LFEGISIATDQLGSASTVSGDTVTINKRQRQIYVAWSNFELMQALGSGPGIGWGTWGACPRPLDQGGPENSLTNLSRPHYHFFKSRRHY